MNRLLLLLLLLLAPVLATTPAAGVGAQADPGALVWTAGEQAELDLFELALPHHALRRARRTASVGQAANLPPTPVPPEPLGPSCARAAASTHEAPASPAPLRPYVTTLPPPSLA